MPEHHVLLIEDEQALRMTLSDRLAAEGYGVECSEDGLDGLKRATESPYDLILLDVMLPGKNGFEVCREIRQAGLLTPIIMLTARSSTEDKVVGLKIGADDYVPKPFSPRELLARVKAILRRAEPAPRENLLALGDVMIDVEGREVTVDGHGVELTAKEFDLLTYFVESPGVVHSRDRLLDRVWGMSYPGGTRTVDVHVGQLRRKLGRPELIRTVRGAGYKAVTP